MVWWCGGVVVRWCGSVVVLSQVVWCGMVWYGVVRSEASI